MTRGSGQVPFTVAADLDLGATMAPWLRAHGADVTIRRGVVPETLPNAESEGVAWQYARDRLLIVPPCGVRFLVEGGTTSATPSKPPRTRTSGSSSSAPPGPRWPCNAACCPCT